jgi:hypothetical protein
MQFPVPQFIDVEDTVVGPLTVKQSVYLGAAAVIVFMASLIFTPVFAILIALPALGAGIALSFYKPNGRPLIVYIANFFLFTAKAKLYVWRRDPEGIIIKRAIKKESIKDGITAGYKVVSRNRLHELAWMLDTRQAMDVEGEEERE